jgi:organic radical activating enzyme
MDKIKRFIECVIPVTACNLRCSYCYVIQRNNRNNKMPEMKYSAEQIGAAFKKERWGGICYINICGQGETLLPKETLEIAYQLLKQGHYINITTNGTISARFDEIATYPEDFLQRMNFAFSFHYLELKRLNLLDIFFENIEKVKKSGASFCVQINLCDEYLPYLNEIKKISLEKTGAFPQVAATRKEIRLKDKILLRTDYSVDEYKKFVSDFNSPLFDFTMKNFNVKQKGFCYAGDWSFQLDLSNGLLRRCYSSNITQNIFENPETPIKFVAMGHACKECYCINSSHFMSLGVIPSVKTPSYAALRDREEAKWYNDTMKSFLNTRLYESNDLYTKKQIFKSFLFKIKEENIILVNRLKKVAIKALVALRLRKTNKQE